MMSKTGSAGKRAGIENGLRRRGDAGECDDELSDASSRAAATALVSGSYKKWVEETASLPTRKRWFLLSLEIVSTPFPC